MITLGINYSQMHDSSACLVRDGELVFAVAEERISRAKHDARFPVNAIRACLDFARVKAEQLDEVCFGWQVAGAAFHEHVASAGRSETIHTDVWCNQGTHEICGASSCACAERVFVFGI